ncbi:RNA methyltransferase [Sulfolobus sp. A20]|uniref:TRM11 family SAM-dependent methyltransferase n=1 Tax=Saccharolobus sp. A20 TaxID=1891280 RepID=UPI000846062A|nr:TRM11 family methyltransferase [Sulfolobus sp. A20]TRM75237.1 RNA methyltransferase [Sulfolobus sp. E5]TRM77172.1 RNA methyltransferase [Sulfolobus sp. A20-N-F8]TRM77755.1 RNA methyltransferase [Sulfolobus sp. B5]TRM80487.1 RNA methyltransferase [Sulfolobus sp. D5]TRM87825.1 RNA methyltransferase [Sulfolobus sp. C3]TRN02582.1 RNA methyltransferase [Sulfolobus sp. F1]
MTKSYAVLKGNNYFLSLAELQALIGTNNIEYLTGVAIFESDQEKISSRSARIKRNGDLLLISDSPEEINEMIKDGCYSVKEDIILGSQRNEFNSIMTEILKGVKVSKRCDKIDLIFTDGIILLGKIRDEIDSKSMIIHSKKKPYSQSGTMNAETSRLLVNLSRPKNTVLDPFTGTGSILIEAKWLNYNCIGVDLDGKILEKAKVNLKFFGYDCDLILASATKLPIISVDSIATDPPYGRSTKEKGEELFKLYENFFISASEVLKKGSFLVFATDSKFDFTDKLKENSFMLKEIHFLYSHKSLTRAIYVVQKR